jgi:hypothetical protein
MTRKVILLLLLIGTSALLLSVLFEVQTGLPLLLSTFFADTSLGLIAGFGSRSTLRKWNLYVRSLVAILLASIGMLLLGYLTHWVLGVGPLVLNSKVMDQIHRITLHRNLIDQIHAMRIDWRTLFNFSKLDWADPVHLALCMLMAGLALDAWPSTSTSEPIELAPLPAPAVPAPARRRRQTSSSSSTGRARVHLPGNWLTRLRPSPQPQPRSRSNGRGRLPVQTEAKIVKEPVVRPKRRRSRRKPKIQFASVEEHRCPYCLDPVTRTDPRGVKECEVCHTLHHADCWAITGICQVPHLNN